MTISAELLSIAENSNTHQPLAPRHERIENERFVLWMGAGNHPSWNVVQRLRLEPDTIDAAVEEVHALLRERGRDGCTWEIGSSATPPDLVERLRERGLVDDPDPYVVGMVLTEEPPPAPAGVEARPVRDLEELAAAGQVARDAFGLKEASDPDRDRARFEEERELGHWRTFAAFVDGELVGSGTSTYLDGAVTLNAGSVIARARGRGAYRALVRARWDDAVARGTPVLVTQAGRMSLPILRRTGFREVAEIWVLLDEFGRG